ncbi:MAG: hypothetical protein FWG13_03715, partial [Leptospirales bacterium]|nr:hypothetical protein [Leptospirales bacterium]
MKKLILFALICGLLAGCATPPQYEGEYKNGKPNGEGVLAYPDGKKYIGEVKDGKRHGQGTQINEHNDGSFLTYEGEWRRGKKSGKGLQTYIRKDGATIVSDGEFINDLMQGQGKMIITLNSGENFKSIEYNGEFKNGKKHGFGTETEKDSAGNNISSRYGTWEND